MDLKHDFEVAIGMDEAWPAFLDMPRVAPCMPGAEITEVIDDRNVEGLARVKVGPVNLRFAGRAEMTEIDHAARSALMRAKGADEKGRGNADADVRFSLSEPAVGRTHVAVTTTLDLTGSVAQYGRAKGLIDEIAKQLISEFVDNLERELVSESQGTVPDGPDRPVEPIADGSAQPAVEPEAVSGLRLIVKAALAAMGTWLRRITGRA